MHEAFFILTVGLEGVKIMDEMSLECYQYFMVHWSANGNRCPTGEFRLSGLNPADYHSGFLSGNLRPRRLLRQIC